MALSKETKEKLNNSMNYDAGGMLTAAVHKATAMDAPVLIIGLGGTGVDALVNTKKMIYDRMKTEVKDGEPQYKPKNVEYLAIDTDPDYKNRAIGGIGLDETLQELLIYEITDLSGILAAPTLPTYVSSWIDKDIPLSKVTNGAGGIRQCGRLILFHNIQRICEAIESKIKRVTVGFPSSTPLYVFIISGISGGTGSGSFVDIPYIVGAISKKVDSNRIVQRAGLIVLPDVNMSQPGINESKRFGVMRNGYAALKELDYLMNIENTGGVFEQDYGVIKVGKGYGGEKPPYELCMLISSKNAQGIASSADDAYRYVMNVIAETILNFIAKGIGDNELGAFCLNSWLSNDVDDRRNFVGLQGNDVRPYEYVFKTVGASSARLPLDELMSYLAYLAFDRTRSNWDKWPDNDEILQICSELGIDQKVMENDILFEAPRVASIERYTYNEIKERGGKISDELDQNYESRKAYVDKKIAQMLEEYKARINSEDSIIIKIFKDIDKGPSYVVSCLAGSSSGAHPCVVNVLANIRDQLFSDKPSVALIEKNKREYEDAYYDIISSNSPFGHEKKRKTFLESAKEYYNSQFKLYYYSRLYDLCGLISAEVIKKNNAVFDNCGDLLKVLDALFGKYSGIKTEVDISDKASGGKIMSWNIISTEEFIDKVLMDATKNQDFGQRLEEFVADFFEHLYDKASELVDGKKIDLVEDINEFVSAEFEELLGKSMDDYIALIVDADTSVQTKCKQLFNHLNENAEVMFPFSNLYAPIVPNPLFSFISVPKDAGTLTKVFKESTNGKNIIKQSEIKDSIMMLRSVNALPIEAYSELESCHSTYAKNSNEPGLHLLRTSNNTDKNPLPSPIPMEEWGRDTAYVSEIEYHTKLYSYFDRALEYGFIVPVTQTPYFECRWGTVIDIKKILEENGIGSDFSGANAGSARKAIAKLREEMTSVERLSERKQMYLGKYEYNTETNTLSSNPDKTFAKAIFVKMVYARERVIQMVDNCEKCSETIRSLEDFIPNQELYVEFAKALYTSTIYKKRGQYLYSTYDGIEYSFGELQGLENKYPEYFLYSVFQKNASEHTDVYNSITLAVKRKEADMRNSDEEYDKAKAELAQLITSAKEIFDELKFDRSSVEGGERILDMYREFISVIEAQYKGM